MRAARSCLALLLALPLAGCLGEGLVGQPAPAFELYTSDGAMVTEATYRGRFVILDLMATWCLPCRLEVDHLREVQRAYGDRVAIVSVGVDRSESMEDLDAFAARYGATWPHALDHNGSVARAFGLRIIPKLVILDPEGTVVFAREGEVLPAAIARVIDPHAPALEGEGPATVFAVALLAGVAGFLAPLNPYRRFHREGAPHASWAAVALFALLGVLAWRFGGLVSSRATYGSLALGALSAGAVAWWLRARGRPADPPAGRAWLAPLDRAYEAAPHFALAVVLGLQTTDVLGFAAPVAAFVLGLAAGVAGRDAVPPETRTAAGLVGLAIAGAGLLLFGSRVLLA
ncbi:MAG TPA: TlpA disulfide reductase family protein [Candidatus Thermoplasmatota archaeon]|nr:TlpA disulfide reductase family protein [Candidatus Thermoplasmatota archaeon]